MAKLNEGTNNPTYETVFEFPRMLYRKGDLIVDEDGRTANNHHGLPCDTVLAESAEHQAELQADGWALTPADAHGGAKPPAHAEPDARDAEIALLKAQLAEAQKPRVGRPPRLTLTGEEPEKAELA